MYVLFLPHDKQQEYLEPVTGLEVAAMLNFNNPALIRVNGELWDLTRTLPHQAKVELIARENPECLSTLRHDAAHVMAEAVKILYPETLVTIGPAIENGFYYDFFRETPFKPTDLERIEAKMRELIKADQPFIREEKSRDKAIAFFKERGEYFKVEILESIPSDQTLTFYTQGSFIDLCRGPHMPSTGCIGQAFKLTKLTGAYWRGDAKKAALQRIYGTAWATEQQLADHLHQLEEAEKRDHRKLGPQLGLFHMQSEAPGCVFWHPKGWTMYRLLQNYIRDKLGDDYVEVNTPQILNASLWHQSGHMGEFRENMFVIPEEPEAHVIKPMNCPCHVQIFNQGVKSYRDLPLRMAEFGSCHRNEPKGAMHGLLRVKAFVQDDAHIFCTPAQIVSETQKFCTLLRSVYLDLGFTNMYIRFSDRPAQRAGSDEIWDTAEASLRHACAVSGIDFVLNPGEGAFYGPKLEFVLKDAMGRDWQCGTLQVDFVLPERLSAFFVDEDGVRKHPVMLHRAILGTFERMIGILIEHYEGKMPLWLAPAQVVIATITSEADTYATEIWHAMKAKGIRAELDVRNEKIGYKVREHVLQKPPYIVVVGKQEIPERKVAVRQRGSEQSTTMTLDAFIDTLQNALSTP